MTDRSTLALLWTLSLFGGGCAAESFGAEAHQEALWQHGAPSLGHQPRARHGRREFLCFDGRDNDRDGFVDCADFDCAHVCTPPEPEQDCSDGIDNDMDGAFDCLDMDCADQCEPEDCFDGLDNDSNGFTDCDDLACLLECGM